MQNIRVLYVSHTHGQQPPPQQSDGSGFSGSSGFALSIFAEGVDAESEFDLLS